MKHHFRYELFQVALSNFIRTKTEELGKRPSLREIAKQTGVSYPAVDRAIHGYQVDVNTIFALCNWIGKPAIDFYL